MRKLGTLFHHKKDNYQQALAEFSRSLTLIVDFDQLLENLEGKLKEIADITQIHILLRDADTQLFEMAGTKAPPSPQIDELPLRFNADDRLVQWLSVNETPLVVQGNPGVILFLAQWEQEIIQHHHIKIIIPLIVMNRVNGMVLLGPKANGTYSKNEIDLLVTLLSQSALAFENALLYKEQKQRLKKMFRSDRLATIGQIAAGAAHEIRNPLTSIRSTIQYLKNKDSDEERREMMDELISEVDRIDEIIRGLLSFSKPVQPQKERFNLTELMEKTLHLTASTARRNNVRFQFAPSGNETCIHADPQQLRQVFMNIILNAVQAMPNGGTLSILIDRVLLPGRPALARLTFTDTGSGIPEKEMEHIFDPFFTTKNDGTGLGLSISYGIIQQHGGDIEVQSGGGDAPSGTSIIITLPSDERTTA